MRFRRLAVVAALVLGAGLTVPVIASVPALADVPTSSPVYCSFGDTFYDFSSPGDGDVIDTTNTYPVLVDDEYAEYGDLLCQVKDNMPGFYEWALKGTSGVCLTLDKAASYEADYKPCAGLASQNWALVDYLGNNKYGGLQSNYTNDGYRYMHDNGGGLIITCPTGWNPNDGYWNWQLGGPFR